MSRKLHVTGNRFRRRIKFCGAVQPASWYQENNYNQKMSQNCRNTILIKSFLGQNIYKLGELKARFIYCLGGSLAIEDTDQNTLCSMVRMAPSSQFEIKPAHLMNCRGSSRDQHRGSCPRLIRRSKCCCSLLRRNFGRTSLVDRIGTRTKRWMIRQGGSVRELYVKAMENNHYAIFLDVCAWSQTTPHVRLCR